MTAARYIMIGGFLGAGKTTALLRLSERLASRGVRVGLITNDQSAGLADTRLLATTGLPVEEITGGCFCCRFSSLVDAAERLTRAAAPDIFLAEPVGSCTDLKATVSYPLRRMYGDGYTVAPFSVMVDPERALRVLGLEPGRRFSPKVLYVYEKQLEEADIIVINKVDAVADRDRRRLRDALRERCAAAALFEVSARDGTGLDAWFEAVLTSRDERTGDLDIDYDTYADGEALLGWVNCTVNVGGAEFDGNDWLQQLALGLRRRLREREVEIAHLKLTLMPAIGNDLASLNLVRTDGVPEASYRLHEPLDAGELVLNLRAEADPDLLRSLALATLAEEAARARLEADIVHLESFRPSRPTPTHRLVVT